MFVDWLKHRLTEAGLSELSPGEIAGHFDDATIAKFLTCYNDELREEKYGRFRHLFPDETHQVGETTFHSRTLYPRHMEFFAAGAQYDERCMMAGNRVGKTICGAFESTCHLTGKYPKWWSGRRFPRPIRAWAAGKTNESTRDIVQKELLGEVTFQGNRKTVDGTGIIPTELIGRGSGQLTWKQGSPDLIDWVKIKHVTGGWSRLGLKSYQQGRGAFEGTAQHLIWVDEEPELDVYDEARIRTMTTGGITMLTYTPLEGLTDTVLSFLPAEMRPPTDEGLNQHGYSGGGNFGAQPDDEEEDYEGDPVE